MRKQFTFLFFILSVLLLFILSSCNIGKFETSKPVRSGDIDIEIVIIDECQYVFKAYDRGCMFAHKGNCNNPIHQFHVTDTVYIPKYVILADKK